MSIANFLKQIFTKYEATSIDKLHTKAHDILLALEQKEDILDYETLRPDTSFDYIFDQELRQQFREELSRDVVNQFLLEQESYAIHKRFEPRKPVTYFVVKTRLIKFQMDLVDVGFLISSYRYILSIIDMFSKYAVLVPLPNKSADAVANALDKLFSYPPLHLDISETVPKLILSDSSKDFQNNLVRTVCLKRGIGQIFSKPYHPLGIIERFNQTIKRPIRKLHAEQNFPRKRRTFCTKLQVILTEYNTSVHRSTGYAPIVVQFTTDTELLDDAYRILTEYTQNGCDNWLGKPKNYMLATTYEWKSPATHVKHPESSKPYERNRHSRNSQ